MDRTPKNLSFREAFIVFLGDVCISYTKTVKKLYHFTSDMCVLSNERMLGIWAEVFTAVVSNIYRLV